MNAKEMFKKLGYKYSKINNVVFEYTKKDKDDCDLVRHIRFAKQLDNEYIVTTFNLYVDHTYYVASINIDLLKAIQKQCEELGLL